MPLVLPLVADAYCLLDVYSVLSSNPANFGLPADLHSMSSNQSEMSKDKTQKEKQYKKTKQTLSKEVRGQLPVVHNYGGCDFPTPRFLFSLQFRVARSVGMNIPLKNGTTSRI